jgi:putative endonuclease
VRSLVARLRDAYRRRRVEKRGRRGERVVARYLRRCGLRILARNVRCGGGEIDLVALDGDTLVFVEVKSRTGGSRCEGLEKVNAQKRRSLRRSCRWYLRATHGVIERYRVDGVAVEFAAGRLRDRVRGVRWDKGILSLDSEGW